ncbi:MAG: MBL fold metallo-hydrolase [Micropepsaceae bacterium]
MLRWFGYIILTLVALGAAAYYWLIVDASGPWGGNAYAIDLAEVRSLANSIRNDKPTEIRLERIAAFKMPFTAMVAGESWAEIDAPVYSYQVVYPGAAAVVIDAAIDGVQAAKNKEPTFDAAAYARMQSAMTNASNIVITHEHLDHIGGITAAPNLSAILAQVRLTKEQVDHPEKMGGLKFPDGALSGYTPLTYDKYHVLSPGVVLIKAPGHTPGSQLVFVQLADGREYLFLGDVAWRYESVERVRTRARFVSWWFLGEDRDAVLHELAEFKRLSDAEPKLIIVPGHDIKHMEALAAQQTFAGTFK